MHFSILATCTLVAGVIAAPTSSSKRHALHERRNRLPAQWSKSSRLDGETLLPMRVGLTQSNLHKADEFLMDVSHPKSANFGKHWSAKQIAETFAPSDAAVNAVLDWLSDAGIANERVKQSQGLNWMNVNVTVTEAESLLQTEYWEYTHKSTGKIHVACDDYSIPAEIQEHVDMITPTVHFNAKVSRPKKKRAMNKRQKEILSRQISAIGHQVASGAGTTIGSPDDASLPKPGAQVSQVSSADVDNCDVSITPDCLRALYNVPANNSVAPGNSYGIVEYTPQAYLPGDLDLFFSEFAPELNGSRPIFESIDGGLLQDEVESFNYNAESDLDLEYAMALVSPQEVTLYQTGDLLEGASFNDFLDALDGSYCAGDDPNQDAIYPDPYGSGYGVYKGPKDCGGFAATNVISTSYAYNEADLTPAYEMRQCYEYMKLGLQGVTFLYSSGDYGVAGNGGQCIDPVSGDYNNGTSGIFNPSFPGTCPYVTVVGATQVKVGATVTQPEEAAESVIYSGGGFSNVFPVPDYQASAVATYFAEHAPPYSGDVYNNSQATRGFPDVSANGVNYVIAVDNEFSYVYGTSASSPTFGAIMTLVNAERLEAGKSPVGFINPVLYANPDMLNDITEGGNQGCGTSGFESVTGWDPVTGLGTPNYPKMVDVWLALP